MMKRFTTKKIVLLYFVASLFLTESVCWSYQRDEVAQQEAAEEKPAEDKETKTDEAAEQPITDTAQTNENETSIASKFIRFHMWDGSIVGGEVTVDSIEVKTEFGNLRIPVNRILKFYPGLDSIPELRDRIATLVQGLGDKDFDVRERSHKELVAMGIQLRDEIQRFDDGGSAERKKHLAEIRKEIDELMDDMEDFDENTNVRPLIRGDEIVTPEFSVVGKILQEEFKMGSKFGVLTVGLSDIQMGDRSFNESKPDIRKSVDINATAFFQRKPASTRLRVNRGDKISIRASGIVQWTNWSTSSGPDGLGNQGQWQGMNSGCLAARIGDSGPYIKIGSNGEFTAKQSGVLYLGIAIRDNYANNNGYRWDGKYTAKIVVKPSASK